MTKNIIIGLSLLLPSFAIQAQDVAIEQALEVQEASEEVVQKPREMLYVTDQLRLSLYPKASDRTKALAYLNSGDKLGILEIEGQYALVIAPTGRRGWVKRGFLLPQPTAKLLLNAEKKTTEALRKEIEKLANSKVVIDQYERDMDELTENLKVAEAARENAEQTVVEIQEAEAERVELEAAIQEARESKTTLPIEALVEAATAYWQYLVPILLFFLLLGSLISKMIINARIKRRFHGLKLW
jgi:SH3 domain protein